MFYPCSLSYESSHAVAHASQQIRSGDADLLLRAHATLAEHADAVPVQAAHALWSGQLAEASNKPDEALRLYRLTLSLRPASLTAFDGARRQLLAAQDADGLRERLYQRLLLTALDATEA